MPNSILNNNSNNTPNPRNIAYKILLKIEIDNSYSSLLLQNSLKENKLSKLDVSFVSAIVYGVIERQITLDYILKQYSKIPLRKIEKKTLVILRMGLYQILYMDKVPDSAAVNESVKLAKKQHLIQSSGFINGILRSFLRADKEYKLPDVNYKSLYLYVLYSCPEEIISMWLKSYGEENTKGILKSLFNRPPLYARVNTLKISTDDLIKILKESGIKAEKTDILNTALLIENTGSIDKIKAFQNGLFYIQDLSSQICVELISAKPHHLVMDVCSAPGGKSTGCAINMQNKGKVYAYDMYEHKVKLINSSLKRLGINIVNSSVRDAQKDNRDLPLMDRVLCDVPCSGLGILRRKPEIRYKKDILDNTLPEIQYEILKNNSRYVSFGGLLIYSTCTLNPKENREVADRFLHENKDFEPYNIKMSDKIKRGINEPENQLTLFPHINNTDGFFISVFRKRG